MICWDHSVTCVLWYAPTRRAAFCCFGTGRVCVSVTTWSIQTVATCCYSLTEEANVFPHLKFPFRLVARALTWPSVDVCCNAMHCFGFATKDFPKKRRGCRSLKPIAEVLKCPKCLVFALSLTYVLMSTCMTHGLTYVVSKCWPASAICQLERALQKAALKGQYLNLTCLKKKYSQWISEGRSLFFCFSPISLHRFKNRHGYLIIYRL